MAAIHSVTVQCNAIRGGRAVPSPTAGATSVMSDEHLGYYLAALGRFVSPPISVLYLELDLFTTH